MRAKSIATRAVLILANHKVYRVACLKAKRGVGVQNRAAEIRLRAERKAGTLLGQLRRSNGGRPATRKNSGQRGPSFTEAIKGIVTESTAKRWQQEARIDEQVFRAFINDVKASINTDKPTELTAAALRRAWGQQKPRVRTNVETPDGSRDPRDIKRATTTWLETFRVAGRVDPMFLTKMDALRAHFGTKGLTDTVTALVDFALTTICDAHSR